MYLTDLDGKSISLDCHGLMIFLHQSVKCSSRTIKWILLSLCSVIYLYLTELEGKTIITCRLSWINKVFAFLECSLMASVS